MFLLELDEASFLISRDDGRGALVFGFPRHFVALLSALQGMTTLFLNGVNIYQDLFVVAE